MSPRVSEMSQLEGFDPAVLLLGHSRCSSRPRQFVPVCAHLHFSVLRNNPTIVNANAILYLPSPFLFSYLHYKRYNHHPVSPVCSLPLHLSYLPSTLLHLFHALSHIFLKVPPSFHTLHSLSLTQPLFPSSQSLYSVINEYELRLPYFLCE